MIKLLIAGIWACIVTAGAAYFAVSMKLGQAQATKQEEPEVLQLIRPAMISVPVIGANGLRGYALAQFSFSVRDKLMKQITIPLEPLMLDESFRVVYASETEDFSKMKKKNLAELAKAITEGINKRLGFPAIADVMIEQMNYVSKEEIRRREAQ